MIVPYLTSSLGIVQFGRTARNLVLMLGSFLLRFYLFVYNILKSKFGFLFYNLWQFKFGRLF